MPAVLRETLRFECHGWIDIIPKLASAGADPNAPGPEGRTLLDQAGVAGDPDRVALLLKIGADPNYQPTPGNSASPLQKAFENRSPVLFELFLKQGAKPPQGDWGSLLWQAYHMRDREKTRLLLSHGAHPSPDSRDGLSLLETAVQAGEGNFVKLLLDYACPAGRALFLATAKGDHHLAGLMLGLGVSPNLTRGPTRETPLSLALAARHDRVAEQLILHGANPDLCLPEGQSALHLAVAAECPRTLRQLLASGANPNAPFALPGSPAFLRQVRPGVMRWILKMDRNVSPLMLAADSSNIQTARYLIEAGATTGVHTRATALWPINFASRRSDVRMMRLFLGQNPLHEERYIEIRLSEQRARVFDAEGIEIFTTKISTGRRGYATPTGEYAITNKHREWTSTLYHASMAYFQRLSCGDLGLHQGNVPGYPASPFAIRAHHLRRRVMAARKAVSKTAASPWVSGMVTLRRDLSEESCRDTLSM